MKSETLIDANCPDIAHTAIHVGAALHILHIMELGWAVQRTVYFKFDVLQSWVGSCLPWLESVLCGSPRRGTFYCLAVLCMMRRPGISCLVECSGNARQYRGILRTLDRPETWSRLRSQRWKPGNERNILRSSSSPAALCTTTYKRAGPPMQAPLPLGTTAPRPDEPSRTT